MIKNIFRITLATYIWKRYSVVIISTAVLFVYFWLVGKIHSDYVSYIELNDESKYLGLSFLLKWFAFLVGFLVYLLVNSARFSLKNEIDNSKESVSNTVQANANNDALDVQEKKANNQQDPFAQIREKPTLRSRADIVIEKKAK